MITVVYSYAETTPKRQSQLIPNPTWKSSPDCLLHLNLLLLHHRNHLILRWRSLTPTLSKATLILSRLPCSIGPIISISETWLYSFVSGDLIRLENYFLIRRDREGKEGGGVACYIHYSLKARVLASSPNNYSNSPEYLILEISSPTNEKLLFASVYRRPGSDMFHDFFRDFTNVSHAYYNIIIAGDLNCKLNSNCYESRYLREMVNSLSLHIVASEPTYHTALADSWLDLYVIDSINKQASFSKSETPFIAGHDLLELTYAFDTGDTRDRCVTRRTYRNFSDVEFCETLNYEFTTPQFAHLSVWSDDDRFEWIWCGLMTIVWFGWDDRFRFRPNPRTCNRFLPPLTWSTCPIHHF